MKESRSPTPTTSIVFFLKFTALFSLLLSICVVPVRMTVKGGTSQACAACKYQRRKCSDQCPLAPYFPASNPKLFQNAHRLFGVSNMMKILKKVNDDQKHDAMQSIIYESNMRQRFPVHGCCGIIRQLYQQVQQTMDELCHVNARLHMIREQQFHCQNNNNNLPLPPTPSQHLQQPMIGSNIIPVYPYQFDQQHHPPPPPPPPVLRTPVAHVGPSNQLLTKENKGSHVEINKKTERLLWGQPDFDNINGNSLMACLLQFFTSQVPFLLQMGVPQHMISYNC